MPEQPSQFICEICGGAHPTDNHDTNTETAERAGTETKEYDVKRITDKKRAEFIIEQITELIKKDFDPDPCKRFSRLSDFGDELREFYKNDEEALRLVNQEVNRITGDYEDELAGVKKSLMIEKLNRDTLQGKRARIAESNIKYYRNQLQEMEHYPLAWRFFGGKKRVPRAVYYIASFLKKSSLDEQDPVFDLKESLKGKRILVLGDDVGSLSETLRAYGAESYGIEKGKFNVLVAHSGALAKDRNQQDQVIEGDIADFYGDEETPLLKKLMNFGPFDMIFSDYVFNYGSGIEKVPGADALFEISRYLDGSSWKINMAARETIKKELLDSPKKDVKKFKSLNAKFRSNCDRLLNDNGLQLHLSVESPYFFDVMYEGEESGHSTVVVPKNPHLRTYQKVWQV